LQWYIFFSGVKGSITITLPGKGAPMALEVEWTNLPHQARLERKISCIRHDAAVRCSVSLNGIHTSSDAASDFSQAIFLFFG
jgi:hypothetical protein